MIAEAISRDNPFAYVGHYVAPSGKAHPKAYKQPAPRKCDGTMLFRPVGARESIRIPLPEWLRRDAKPARKGSSKIHPLGYQMPKPRKDDGTMLVRVNGPDAEPVRIPTPDNFRIVHFPRLDRQPRSDSAKYDGPVENEAYAEHFRRQHAGEECRGTCHIPPVGCSVCTPVAI